MAIETLRRIARAPGYAVPVFVLAAIAVAVNATATSAIDALAWRALPFADADRLVELRIDLEDVGLQVGLSEPLYARVRADTTTFVGAVGSFPSRPLADAAGQSWSVQRVTADFTQVLGVAPALGRAFVAAEGVDATARPLLVSDTIWRARLGGDRGALGRVIELNGQHYTVVGVMPPGFAYPDAKADAWLPYVPTVAEREQDAAGGFGQFVVAARLAPGVDATRAGASLAAVLANAPELARLRASPMVFAADARPWRERYTGGYLKPLALLQAAGALLLAVVVANLANLVLARLLARRREFAIRRAVGAGTGALLRAVIADVLPPALAGVLVGLALAPAGVAMLRAMTLLPRTMPGAIGVGIAAPLAALATAAILVGVVAAVAIIAVRREPARRDALRDRANSGRVGRGRGAMIVVQVALTTVLVGATGLLWRSAAQLAHERPGFDPAGVLMTTVDMTFADANAPASTAMRDRIAQLPGVRFAAIADAMPFGTSHFLAQVRTGDEAGDTTVRSHSVTDDYFAAMGMPLMQGSGFVADASSQVIVDERYARQHFADAAAAIGATIRVANGDEAGTTLRIVGVVPTVKHKALDERLEHATMYERAEAPGGVFYLVTRVDGDPAAFVEPVRRLLRDLAPDAVLSFNRPLSEALSNSLAGRLALLRLIGLFAIVTLVLAAVGLYALLNLDVRARTGEIGVRMALGADRGRVLRWVLGQGGAFVVPGLAIGLFAGVPLSRVIADQLYRVGVFDPVTWCAVVACVIAAALAACALPAWRASRVSPRTALEAL